MTKRTTSTSKPLCDALNERTGGFGEQRHVHPVVPEGLLTRLIVRFFLFRHKVLPVNRRELIQAAGFVAAAAVTTQALAQSKPHDHSRHTGNVNLALINAVSHAVVAGQACFQHCVEQLAKGSKDMAACAMNVQQMLTTCDTLQKLASYNSTHLKKMARVAHDVCVDCEKECRKHEKMHAQCQATADACAEVVKETKKLAI
jgi:Cys-rich four helix bundle protein (predicted Tat secretion target)